jgi:hypothetical protein
MSKFKYKDIFGQLFYVERAKGEENHVWDVHVLDHDEDGPYERFADIVDDCDTEDEAVKAWQKHQEAIVEARIHELGEPN